MFLAALVGPALGSVSLLAACAVMSARRPLWYDELATRLLVTDRSLSHMLRAMVAGVENAPPLYHLIARGWVTLFGSSELALRMLSAAGMVIALWLLWAALRRLFSLRAATIGAVAVFGTSSLILRQNHEVRFYGVWMAFCALAIYFCVRMLLEGRPRRMTLIGAVLAHAGVVLTHTFGVLYVGALCLGVIGLEAGERRFRPAVYGTYIAGALAFLPWLAPTLRQSNLGAARSWIPVPGIGGFLPAYQFGMAALPLIVLTLVMLTAWSRSQTAADSQEVGPAKSRNGGEAPAATRVALTIATALFLVPVLLFVVSHLVRPLFLDRYMIPSTMGWAFVLGLLANSAAVGNPRAVAPGERGRMRGRLHVLPGLALWGLVAAMAVYPLLMAVATPVVTSPAAKLEELRDSYSLPGRPVRVAVESGLMFLALQHYGTQAREEYVYPTDWDLAVDPESPDNAAAFDQYLRLLRQHYDVHGVVETSEALCGTDRFIVLDGPWLWFERHVNDDPAFTNRSIGQLDEETVVRLVEREPGTIPRACG